VSISSTIASPTLLLTFIDPGTPRPNTEQIRPFVTVSMSLQGWIKKTITHSYILNHRPDEIRLGHIAKVVNQYYNCYIDTSAKLMRDLAQLSNKDLSLSLVLSLLSASHHTTLVTSLFAHVPSLNPTTYDGDYHIPLNAVFCPPCPHHDLKPARSNTYFATQQPFSQASQAEY
jgi:hypothetical protein